MNNKYSVVYLHSLRRWAHHAAGTLALLLATASAAQAQTLAITGTGGSTTNDVTAFVDRVEIVRASDNTVVTGTIANAGFEIPAQTVGGFTYRPASGSWTFTGLTGVSYAGAGSFGAPATPDGVQTGFVQNNSTSSTGNTISQALTLAAGSYRVRFLAAQRATAPADQGLVVTVGGVQVGATTPASTSSFVSYTSNTFTVSASGTVTSAPTVTSFNSTSAPVGTSITLTGTNLTGATAVSFNGTAATTFAVVNSTTLTATVPNGATSGNVTVTTPVGISTGVAFTVETDAPALTTPYSNLPNNGTPPFSGTAPASSQVKIYLTPSSGTTQLLATVTATGGTFSYTPTTALASGSYSAYATAQASGKGVSAASPTIYFTLDSTPPTVASFTRLSPTTALTNASSVTFRLVFSEDVLRVPNGLNVTSTGSLGTPNLLVTALGGVGTYGNSAYDVTLNNLTTGVGTLTVSIISGIIVDAAGNTLAATGPSSQFYSIDRTVPTATLSTTAGSSTSTTPIPFSVMFSKTVTGFSVSSLTVTNGTVTGNQVAGSGVGPYTFSVTPTGFGYVTVQVAGNTVQDLAGNRNDTSGPLSVQYTSLPTLTSLSPSSGPAGTSITLTGTNLTGATAVSFNGTAATTFAVVNSTTITATVPSGATTGPVTVTTPGSTSNGVTFTVVTAAPTLTSPADGSLTKNRQPTITGTAPAGSTITVYLATGSGAARSIGTTTATGGSFSLSLATALADNTYSVYATAQSNGATVSANSSTNTFTVDGTSPTVTSLTSSAGASGSSTTTKPLPFSVTFSEAVTGFSANGINIINGSVTSGPTGSGSGPYTFSVTANFPSPTPTAVSINANAAQDAAGNGSAPSLSSYLFYYEAPPTLISSNPTSGPVGTQVVLGGTNLMGATAVRFNGTAATTFAVVNSTTITATVPSGATSGPVTVTAFGGTGGGVSFTVTPLTVTTATPTNIATMSATLGGSFTGGLNASFAEVGIVYVVGTGIPTLSNQKATSMVYNPAPATASFSVSLATLSYGTTYSARAYVTDNTGTTYGNVVTFATAYYAPYLLQLSPNSGLVGTSITLTGSYLDVATGVSFNGTPATFAANANGTLTATVPAGATSGTVTVTTPGGVSNGIAFTVTPAPTLTSPPDNSYTNNARVTFAGTAPANSNVALTLTFSGGSSVTTTTATSANTFSAGPVTLADGTYRLFATVSSGGVTIQTNTNAFTVDTTPPFAAVTTTAGNSTSAAPIPFTVMFSEAVTGFSASSVSITNGTITGSISSVGNAYSFGVTPTTNGLISVRVLANGVRDAAGNGNLSAGPLSVTYTAPITATTWTGTISPDWYVPGNWSSGTLPDATTSVTIPNGTIFSPLISAGTATTRSLTINSGATLRQTGGTLDVRGDLVNNGSFGPIGGTVVLGTTAVTSLLGSSAIRFWNLTVQASGAQLSTSIGASVRQVLTLTGSLATRGNVFTLESNSAGDALVVNNGGVVNGTATVQRYIDPSLNPGLGYRHYSAPVSNSTVGDLATPTGFTPEVSQAAAYNTSANPNAVTPFPTVFYYDQAFVNRTNASSNFDKGFVAPLSLATPLEVGRGYTVNIGASELVDFAGSLNNGDITLTLARNQSGTLNADDAGWQFLGNPYPAPLDYSLVAAADRPNLDAAIYVYRSTGQYAGQYRGYVNGMGGNPVLPVAQGFFAHVSADQSTGSLTFRNSQRLTAPDGTTFQRPTTDLRPRVQLELRGSTGPTDAFYAYAEPGATSAFDSQYDAAKLLNPTGLNLASAAGADRLAIDGRAAFTAATAISLVIGVPAAGTYSLSTAALANLPAGLTAYLYDSQTGHTLPLAVGTPYTFSVAASQAAAPIVGRFVLQFSPLTPLATSASLSAAEVAIYPNPAHERFTVQVPAVAAAPSVQAELLNTLGQVVRHQVAALPAAGAILTVETAGLATGVYTLRLQAGSSTLAKRVVIQ